MGVLVAVEDETELDDDTTELSSKFVCDWRWRDDKWTRRSRLVARKFRSLAPDLDDLCSPASISSTTKLLAAMAATSEDLKLYSLDISDACLMVPQKNSQVHWRWQRKCLQNLVQLAGSKRWRTRVV